MYTFFVQPVYDGFHGNVAGQIPVLPRPLPPSIQMAEKTVEDHMEIRPVYINAASAVEYTQIIGIVVNSIPVSSHRSHGRIRLKGKAAEGNVQKMHI